MLVLVGSALAACGGKGGGDNGNNNTCPAGFRPEGRACVPIFDDCPGPAEIPVLGGGCHPVGVTECATGFVSDGEGGCDPVLPQDACPDGTMEVIGQTECQPVGVTECATGFVSDGEGGCDAVLPQDPCPNGTIEVLGHTDCQPLGECGTGTWGNIVPDATTVFVDQSADATGADGSDASPFVTIADALAVAEPGGQIAVAAGDYVERLLVNQPVRLSGRCAELVTIRGREFLGEDRPPVQINSGGSGTTVKGVTLTGDAEGLVVGGAVAVVVEEVQIIGTGGWGIFLENEAEANFRRARVEGATGLGVAAAGSTVRLNESVVRGTRPTVDGESGRGIEVDCASYACGNLAVSRSLVEGNRDTGIFLGGADSSVVGSVVRNTLCQQSDETGGRGIETQCHPTLGGCGTLAVSGSVVAGNMERGIFIMGADAVIETSVIRDTLPRQTGDLFGRGIEARCHDTNGRCGSLTLSNSVVAANREVGVFLWGVDAAIEGSIIRDTLPEQNDETAGRGIHAACDLDVEVCGTVAVSRSLVLRNREVGLFVWGVDAVIEQSVVKDNLPQQSDGTFGRGIAAECDITTGVCGNVTVSGSLVINNKEIGVFTSGMETSIEGSVIRDTEPQQSDGEFGRGINARCHTFTGSCGSLAVSGCLVAANRGAGIFVFGVETAVENSVVRDTLPYQSDQWAGRGIDAGCDLEAGVCASLTVSHSLVAGNREMGVFLAGAEAFVEDSIIKDTLPMEIDGTFGRGINAQCNFEAGACGSLALSNTLASGNSNVSIFVAGVDAVINGVAVKDSRPNETGSWAGRGGVGIYVVCDYPGGSPFCPTVQMSGCVVDSSHSAGVALQGGTGSINGSFIRNVFPQPLDDKYGYGLQVEGAPVAQAPQTWFDVQSCRFVDASVAGILYVRAQGAVSGTQVIGADFSIVMNEGSAVTVTDDNQLSGIYEDEPTWQNLEPSPAPAPALPSDSP